MKSKNIKILIKVFAIFASLISIKSAAQDDVTALEQFGNTSPTPPACVFEKGTNDFYYDENFIYFHVKQGTLEKNLKRILAMTYPNHSVQYEVNRHTVISDTCIAAESADALIQKLIEGYEKPAPIVFGTFPNNVAGFFYITSPKLAKYFRAGSK